LSAKSAADVVWRGRDDAPADARTVREATASSPIPAAGAARSQRLTRRRLLLAGLQLVVLVISAAVIYGLVRKVNPGQVISKAGHVSWRLVGFAIALNLATTLLRARRSQILLKQLGHHVPFVRMNWVDLAGQTLSWLTPAASGDLSRPYLWRNHDRVPVSAGVATVIYERLVTIVQLGVVGGVLAAAIYLPPAAVAGLSAAGLVVLAAPWWVSLATRHFLRTELPAGRHGVLAGIVRSLVRLEELGLAVRVGAIFALYSLLVFVISGFQVLILVWAVGAGVSLSVAIAAYCISQVIGSLSTLPFGIGAADVTTAALLVAGGLGKVDAVAVTVLVRLVITLPLGIAGAIGISLLGRPRIPDETRASDETAAAAPSNP
jgi:uncharacterized membrane protein YbhN (UPF0104 family)